MKIRALGYFRNFIGAAAITAAGMTVAAPALKAQTQTTKQDVFTLVHNKVPASGTQDILVLSNAPSPEFVLQGKKKKASIVVNLSENVLYHYDEKGNAVEAFLVATGDKKTPTTKGISIVTDIQTYPYKEAPAGSQRRKSPRSFGPKAIILETVNPKTGVRFNNGEFIHGNNDAKSLGHYASHGCIRMDNEVIKKLAKLVKRGQFVLIK